MLKDTHLQVYSISPSFVSRVMIQIVSSVVEEMARLIECVTAFGSDGALQVYKSNTLNNLVTKQGLIQKCTFFARPASWASFVRM